MAVVQMRAGTISTSVRVTPDLRAGAIHLKLCFDDGPFADALRVAGAYDLTLLGDDGAPLVSVPGIPIAGERVWPPGSHFTMDQRIDISEVAGVDPTVARVYP